jgi:NAD(P)-dependent dehydrogenase (short-subunit alcohol dehydrogenase family)
MCQLLALRDEADAVVAEIVGKGGQAIAVQADVRADAECRALVNTTVESFGRLISSSTMPAGRAAHPTARWIC